MDIIFMGSPDFAVPCLNALAAGEDNVRAVFTQPDKVRGRRGNKLVPTPVGDAAEKSGIPVYKPSTLKAGTEDGDNAYNIIKEISPQLIVVTAYGRILPQRILDAPEYGCINIHASLLPKYRGAAPIQKCILDGEKVTGVTSMQMAAGLDTGDMLLSAETEIGINETASELTARLSEIGADVLMKTISALKNGTLEPKKQDDSLSSYAGMITKEMCPIDFSLPAEEIHRRICGLSDSPCAQAYAGSKRIKIYHSELVGGTHSLPAGTFIGGKDFDIVCGDGKIIRFIEVQSDSGKRMCSADFLRGCRLEKGAVLTSHPSEVNTD